MQTWFRDLRMVEPRSVKARKSAIASVATLKPPPSRHSTHHAHDDRVQQFRQFRRPSLRPPQSLDFYCKPNGDGKWSTPQLVSSKSRNAANPKQPSFRENPVLSRP